NRLMEQMARQVGQAQNTGLFNGMSTMHQYDGQGYLLASQPGVEPVAMSGGRCPSTAPVRKYDISAINVEITLNQWLDFYPGYMYVLTENIEKVRAEEAKNAKARENEKDQYDSGAVTNGIQGDYIQPLVIRGNQGHCVKITLRNQIRSARVSPPRCGAGGRRSFRMARARTSASLSSSTTKWGMKPSARSTRRGTSSRNATR